MKMTGKILISVVAFMFVFASGAFAQEGNRDACLQKATETLDSLDGWLNEYNQQKNMADEAQKAKYEEWIRELNKLKTLVEQAKNKLEDKEGCGGSECVSDQCGLVDIADQQVAKVVDETQDQIGAESRFGDDQGRQVNQDSGLLGDDKILNDGLNPDDAVDTTYGDRSENSDLPSNGAIGSIFGNESTNESTNGSGDSSSNLPPVDPTPIVSPQ